jgi:RimJ/RimL family protein N-acetyltransferase
MPEERARAEVHLRVLVPDDAEWVVAADRTAATPLARAHGWDAETLERELADGLWASDDRFGWAIIVDGKPSGFTLVTELASGDGDMSIRVAPSARGKGAGRDALRQLADHHFSADPELGRLTGRVHEHNVPMQRVFNAAGFRLEARYRDAFVHPDGSVASEWGYALTRADWQAGRHRSHHLDYDLHGLIFEVEETIEGPMARGLKVSFHQEGRRISATYHADHVTEGELAGVLVGDLLRYRFVHVEERPGGERQATGRGRTRVQRRGDGRLEIVDQWSDDSGSYGHRVLVSRHPGETAPAVGEVAATDRDEARTPG